MSDSPRHNVGSIADPHWVVDEEHYLKAVADSDHFFACWQDTLEQRDKAREDALEQAAKLVEESNLPDAYSEPVLLEIAAAIRAMKVEK